MEQYAHLIVPGDGYASLVRRKRAAAASIFAGIADRTGL